MKNKFLTFLAFIAIVSCTTGNKKIFYVNHITANNALELPYASEFYLPQGDFAFLLTKEEVIKSYAIETAVNSNVIPHENFDLYIVKRTFKNDNKQDVLEIILRTINDENKILDSFKLAESGGTEYCDGFLTESLSIERECNGFVDKYYIDKESGKFIQQ